MKHLLPILGLTFCSCVSVFSAPKQLPPAENALAASCSKFKFVRLNNGNHGESSVTAVNDNSFRIVIKNTAKNNHAIAFSNIRYNAASQQKLIFRIKGKKSNGRAFLTPVLVYERNRKWISASGPNVSCNTEEYKKYTIPLDQNFKLGDGIYTLRQIKFVLNTDKNPKNSVTEIDVSGIRIANADDASDTSGGYIVIPVPVKSAKKNADSALKVYFELDNDDLNTMRMSRVSPGKVRDNLPGYGYRDLLLEHTEGLFAKADSVDQADVIVYARAKKGENAKKILSAMHGGKRLIVYGLPADAEIAKELPVTLERLPENGFAVRKKLSPAAKDHALIKDIKLTDAEFGMYFRAKAKPDAEVLLKFQDGTPYLAERGNMLHFNGGIGADLDRSKTNFYDRTLLRALAMKSPRILSELDRRDAETTAAKHAYENKIVAGVCTAANISKDEARLFRPGRSEKNVGRFGWLVGSPLNTESIGKDLTVTNGAQSYRFQAAGSDTEFYPIRNWKRRAAEGKIEFKTNEPENDANPCALWSGVGTVEYTTLKVIPPAWKGKKIVFRVKNGIDDCDEVLFNGKRIGKTDSKTPYYWTVERMYEIPQDLIVWGKPNKFTMRVINLRGNAQCKAKPELRVGKPASRHNLAVTRTDWTGRELAIYDSGKNPRTITMSLLTPFMLYTFPEKEAKLSIENIADSASWLSNGKLKTVSLTKGNVFYDRKRDGEWSAPWLLLHRKNDSKILMLVFTAKPEKLSARISDGTVDSIHLESSKKNFTVAVGWPWGLRSFGKGLPADAVKRAAEVLPFALNYPVGCDEIYRIDRKNGTVKIIQSFRFKHLTDDWKTPVRKYVFLPPLHGFMHSQKRMVRTEKPLTDFGIDTNLGPILGRMDESVIAFTLPLPDMEKDLIPAGVVHKSLNDMQNRAFEGGVRWSCGGRVPQSAWTFAHPSGKNVNLSNICLFAWNFGITTLLQGSFSLTPENRVLMEKRVRARFIEPLDLYQYKAAFIGRREPFSGLVYPIVFNSFYPCVTDFGPDYGSKVIYGDSNEACTVTVWIAQMLGNLYGQSGMSRLNWKFLQYVMRFEETVDDYAFSAGSCRETGVGAWIDMLNGEYAGMIAYARLAELSGDLEKRDEALYRASVKAVPTIARLFFSPWYEKIHPEARGWNYQITGFGSDGGKLMLFPTSSGNFFASNELFDFSQGLPGSLYHLYNQYALPEVREHLRTRAVPELLKAEKGISLDYLQALAMFGELKDLTAQAEKSLKNRIARRCEDWPGIRTPFELGLVLWRGNGRVGIESYSGVSLSSMRYDPAKKVLEMEYTAAEGSNLVISSAMEPVKAFVNGNGIRVEPGVRKFAVPSRIGKNMLKIHY